MQELILNGTSVASTQLAHACQSPHFSAYEQRVLQFCCQWLSGQETFTLCTSGSTGSPKAIELTRAQMTTSAQLTCRALGLRAGDRALVCLSVEYIAGVMMLVRGLEFDLQLTVIDPVSHPLALFPATSRFDFTAMVPLQLHETLHGAEQEVTLLNRMKGVLIGGAPVSQALENQAQRLTVPLYHTYGMTETVSHIALRRMNGPQRSDRFIPFPGVQLGVDDRGCLHITSALTRGETYQTNDRVVLDPDASFRWLGRIDNVINSGGVKVQVETVETALEVWFTTYQNGVYAERRFFVGALAHARLGQAVVVVIEGEPADGAAGDALATQTAMRQALQASLTPYEIPRQVFFVPRFLETPTGKIDRQANLQRLAASVDLPT